MNDALSRKYHSEISLDTVALFVDSLLNVARINRDVTIQELRREGGKEREEFKVVQQNNDRSSSWSLLTKPISIRRDHKGGMWIGTNGGGIGYTKTRYLDRDLTVINANWHKTKFTWSLGAGLSLKVTNRFNVDAGYRYYDMGKPGHNGMKYGVDAQEIYAGIRYVF